MGKSQGGFNCGLLSFARNSEAKKNTKRASMQEHCDHTIITLIKSQRWIKHHVSPKRLGGRATPLCWSFSFRQRQRFRRLPLCLSLLQRVSLSVLPHSHGTIPLWRNRHSKPWRHKGAPPKERHGVAMMLLRRFEPDSQCELQLPWLQHKCPSALTCETVLHTV